jgi:hypothetical protein
MCFASDGMKKSCSQKGKTDRSAYLVADDKNGRETYLEHPETSSRPRPSSKEVPPPMLYSRLQRHRLQHPEHAIELLLLAVRDEGSARELSDVEEEDVSIRGETIRPPLGGWRGLGKGGDEGFELIGEEGVIGENEEHGEGFEDGALHDMLDVKDLAKGCKRKANEDDR